MARIKAWAEETGELTEDDLLISASVDEEGYSYSVTLLEWIFKKIITALNVAFITKIKIMFFNCKYSFKIMSRSALHKLKWCQVTDEIISGGLWTPLGNFNKVRSDFNLFTLPGTICRPGEPDVRQDATITSNLQ